MPTVQDPQEAVVRQDRLAEGLHPVVADVEDLEVLQPAEDGARQRGEVIAGQVEQPQLRGGGKHICRQCAETIAGQHQLQQCRAPEYLGGELRDLIITEIQGQ